MFQKFYPDAYVDSAYSIDFDSLFSDGYRGLIFDIDNTLVTHGAPPDKRALALFSRLSAIGFSCCLISNNGEGRVRLFTDVIEVFSVPDAHKPSPASYGRAMDLMGTDAGSTVFIGDQIFTDILGANRAGIPSIMVRYICWREEIQIFFKRRLETIILLCYRVYRKRHPPAARGAFFRARGG